MFLASKIFALLTQPLIWVGALLAASLLVRRNPERSRKLIMAALGLLLLIGWLPLPDLLIRHLESQYAEMPPDANLDQFAGIVVLGGASEPGYIAQGHTQPLLNHAAERMTAPVALLVHNPHLRIVFTGGEGTLLGIESTEAQRAKVFFDSMGIASSHVAYEAGSRTTYENAVLTGQLPGMDVTQRWLLVTSAWHMPRSMATFAQAGWNVTAYPVDFRTGLTTPWTAYALESGTHKWELVLHELLGWWAYRVLGRL